MTDWIQYNKQRRNWLDWYSKTKQLYDIFAQEETKTNYVPLRKYDWAKRARARLWGFNIPLLAGDIETSSHRSSVVVVDDFGNVEYYQSLLGLISKTYHFSWNECGFDYVDAPVGFEFKKASYAR